MMKIDVGIGALMFTVHRGFLTGSHVLEGVVRWWVAACGSMLLRDLVHINTNVLLPILARRSAVLPLVTEAKATTLICRSMSCLASRNILVMRRLSSSAT